MIQLAARHTAVATRSLAPASNYIGMIRILVTGMIAALAAVSPGFSSSIPNGTGVPVQMVVTAIPQTGKTAPATLGADDLNVSIGTAPARVLGGERLTGDLAKMQLFVLLDDSARSSLALQFPNVRAFIKSLPPTTQVAVGYMRNGTFILTQGFTTEHEKAASSLRLPIAAPGENGSPYFALSDLAKHWPSKEVTGRRAVLMLTDGVDRYFGTAIFDDPYVDAAIHDATKNGVMVYSIYMRDTGRYGRGDWVTNFAQSRLMQVSQATGGEAYFEGFINPVDIGSFLTNLQNRLNCQYRVTVAASADKGIHSVQVRSEIPGVKIVGPKEIVVR